MEDFKIPIGRKMSRRQSDFEPPQQQFVSVAVLPPRLPGGMAPPTGVGAADVFSWDEAVNWQHNDPINKNDRELSKGKAFMKKVGLTTERKRANPDSPPFTFRQVPYETWRKHYAKDADGNYRGTHAPAQDCLLKPEDVKKWRFDEEPKTNADRWTRGTEVLPVYAEVQGQEQVPDYHAEFHGVPPGEPTVDRNAVSAPSLETEQPAKDMRSGTLIADGKTAQQIIEEAKAKPKPNAKQSWKQMMKRGAEMAMMGN